MIDAQIRAGKYYEDPHVPGDRDELFIWIQEGDAFSKSVEVTEQTEGQAQIDLPSEEMAALFQDGGILEGGTMAAMKTHGAEGRAAFLDEVAKSNGSTIQKKGPRPLPLPAPTVEMTPLQEAISLMDQCLKESSQRASFATAIKGHELSAESVGQLEQHSQYMTSAFTNLQKLTMAGVSSATAYEKLFKVIRKKMEWYESRRKLATRMKAS